MPLLSVMTNTSIDFARDIADEVAPMFKEHGGTTNMAKEYIARVRATRRKNRNNSENRETESVKTDEMHLLHCYYSISRVVETLALGNMTAYSEAIFATLDTDTKPASKSANRRFEQDYRITSELWFEALTLVHDVPDYPITDGFVRGVKELRETKKVPFSLVFAAQINIDVHRALGIYAGRCTETLIKRVDSMKRLLEAQINLHKDMKSPHWSASDEKWLRDTDKRFDWFLNDPLHMARTKAMGNDPEGLEELANTGKHRLLRRSPILSGLALYYYRAETHEVGLKATNAWGSPIPSAQLCDAANSNCIWTDVQPLFKMFGEGQFHLGDEVAKYKDYEARYMVQIGGSGSPLTDRIPPEHSNADEPSRANGLILHSRASIHRHLKDRYQKNGKPMNWSAECIREIMARAESKEDAKKKKRSRKKNKTTAPVFNKDVRLAPTELLLRLNAAMENEMEELAFPYLIMHRFSWTLLSTIKSIYEPLLEDIYGPMGLKDWQIPFAIGAILKLVDEGYPSDDSELLQAASKTLDGMGRSGVVAEMASNQTGAYLNHPFELSTRVPESTR
ncbi:hypothetical protein ACHAQK_002084 [Fusarium lateritium]